VDEELGTFLAQYVDATTVDDQLTRWLAFRDHIKYLSEPREVGGTWQNWRYLPEAGGALPLIDDELVQLWAHKQRQRSLRWLGIDPYAGVPGERNNQLLVNRFGASARAVQRAVVEAADATGDQRAAAYLAALHAHRSAGTTPYPVPTTHRCCTSSSVIPCTGCAPPTWGASRRSPRSTRRPSSGTPDSLSGTRSRSMNLIDIPS
jgi:hypothetical protein